MRHRVAPWRHQFASASLGRRYSSQPAASEKPYRTFIKHRGRHTGGPYWTVATKEEGKDLPVFKPEHLYQVSDLVLDLDAEDARNVREYTADDESRLQEKFKISAKRLAVRESMSRLRTMLSVSRERSHELTFNITHSARITDHDIMSVALRGFIQSNEDERSGAEGQESGRLVIENISQTHRKSDKPSVYKTPTAHELVHTDEDASALKYLIHQGDPRQKPDYMKPLSNDNAIPHHASQDDDHLLRWMMLRQHNLNYTKEKLMLETPTAAHIIRCLQESVDTENGEARSRHIDVFSRVIFHAIAAGADLKTTKPTYGDEEGERASNVALELRSLFAGVLDELAGNHAPYYKALIFANNLKERIPSVDPDIAVFLFGLRLRALAGLNLLQVTAAHCHQDFTREMWSSDVDILFDVHGAINSWIFNMDHYPALRSAGSRQKLLQILTGYGDADKILNNPYRALIVHPQSSGIRYPHTASLRAYEQYIHLLGKLGAVKTLWNEWSTAPQLEAQAKTERVDSSDDISEKLTETFRTALLSATAVADLSQSSPTNKPDLAKCVALDYQSMGMGAESVSEASDSKDAAGLLGNMSREKFRQMMDLSLNEWLERLRELK